MTSVLTLLLAALPGAEPPRVTLTPATIALDGLADRQQLLVTEVVAGRPFDRTASARIVSETPAVCAVSPAGVATPVGDGNGTVVAVVGKEEVRARVRVTNAGGFREPTFERDVIPVLTRAGCNAGACHGKARGQNGFQLSLLGFDPD